MLRLDPPPYDPVLDPATAAGTTAACVIVPLVGVELLGPSLRSAPAPLPERRDRIEHRLQHPAVVQVGRGHLDGERDPVPVANKMLLGRPLAARSALGCGVPADLAPLFFATKLLESRAARIQSIWSATANRSSITRWSLFHTPRRCRSRSRRQQVTPDPQPISCRSMRQGIPLRSTKRIPVSTARSSTGGRPPLQLTRRLGNSGSTTAYNASDTNGFMPDVYPQDPQQVLKSSVSRTLFSPPLSY